MSARESAGDEVSRRFKELQLLDIQPVEDASMSLEFSLWKGFKCVATISGSDEVSLLERLISLKAAIEAKGGKP